MPVKEKEINICTFFGNKGEFSLNPVGQIWTSISHKVKSYIHFYMYFLSSICFITNAFSEWFFLNSLRNIWASKIYPSSNYCEMKNNWVTSNTEHTELLKYKA